VGELFANAMARKRADEALKLATEQTRLLRDELAHATRLELISHLATSIAHEVNQPLCAIASNAQTAIDLLDMGDTEEAKNALKDIWRDARRGSEVIGRIRSMVKKDEPRRSATSVALVIEELAPLLSREAAAKGVALWLDLKAKDLIVVCDRVQLQQVVLNLLLNAVEAVSDASVGPPEVRIRAWAENPDSAHVSFEDNGVGLSQEDCERVFAPFFTTKAKGLGMGLSISRSIITALGGSLWATPGNTVGNSLNARVFVIPTGVNAELVGLTVANGYVNGDVGAGIVNDGTLQISHCVLTGNVNDGFWGGGVANLGGTLEIDSSSIVGNSALNSTSAAGAAILNEQGALTILYSTLSANHSDGSAAGIYDVQAGATATIKFSTLANNTANRYGGSMYDSSGASASFSDTTISGNSAGLEGGGLAIFNSSASFAACTISGNSSNVGGGLANLSGTSVQFADTIVAGNTVRGTNPTGPDLSGGFSSLGHNLIGISDGSSGFANSVNKDIVGTALIPVNPGLAGLAGNGGPTKTMALLPGSPAIDAGNNALAVDAQGNPLTTDQRGPGFPRIVNGTVDIGAFESWRPSVVTTTADSGPGSLRDAITQINLDTTHTLYASPSNPSVDEIDFNITAASDTGGGFHAGTGVATITPQSGLPAITNAVTIDGSTQPGYSGTPLIELNGMNAGAGGNVFGLDITAGNCTVRGLAIYQFGNIAIQLTGGGGNVIAGNYIGTDAIGDAGLGNGGGVNIHGSSGNTIGGTAHGDGNVISDNTSGDGIVFSGVGTTGNVVEGNYIGTDVTGTEALGNGGDGVHMDNVSGNTIGGTTAGAGNTIAYNNSDGVFFNGGSGNSILGNSIHDNGGPGIDLAPGANDNQAAPVLTSVAGTTSSNPTISGTLATAAGTIYRIEFFASPAPTSLTNSAGTTLLGSTLVTGTGGTVSFTASGLSPIPLGQNYLTATATVATPSGSSYTYGDTSAFSSYLVTPPPAPVVHFANVAFDPLTGSVHFGLSATDSTSERIAAGFTYRADFGDGNVFTTPVESGDPSGNGFSHPYAPGIYTASVTAIDSDGVASPVASAVIVLSYTAGDTVHLSGGASAGQVAVATSDEGNLQNVAPQLVLVGVFGNLSGTGADNFTVDFGSTLTTPITLTDGRTDNSNDILTVNGDSSATNVITKTPGQITWGSPVTETVSRSGIPNTVVNANGTTQNYINDPGGNTTINGGPGANTISITATTGSGVVIKGGAGANTYIVDLGSLGGPVTIQNSNSAATNNLVVNGAAGNNTIAVAGNQVTAGTQTITDTASLANLTVNGGSGNNQLSVSALTVPVQNVTLAGAGASTTYNVNAGTVNIVAGTGVNVLNVTGGTVASITAPAGDTQPLAFAHSYTVLDNGTPSVPANGVLANDVSSNGNALTAVLASGPAHGALTLNADGSFTYTPAANFVGSDSFTYQAKGSDGTLSTAAPVTILVTYHFGGFLAPLSSNMAMALNRTVPIKFQLTDYNNKFISSLSAVQSLTVPGGTLNALRYDSAANQFIANWQTKGLAAGTYTVTLVLADGTTYTKPVTLSKTGSASGLTTVAAGGTTTAAGALLGGDIDLYVDNTNGDLTADELARIQDAVTAADAVTEPYGVAVTEVTDPTLADVTLNMDTTSAVGGYADGVLGCTTDAGQITIINGWNFYPASDATQIGSAQYDFETVVEHELGHALGLGHSTDSTSVMYATLNTGTVNRTLTTADLNVADTDTTGACGLHAAGELGEHSNPSYETFGRDLLFAFAGTAAAGMPIAAGSETPAEQRSRNALPVDAVFAAVSERPIFAASAQPGSDDPMFEVTVSPDPDAPNSAHWIDDFMAAEWMG
jgi:hypothetical protein